MRQLRNIVVALGAAMVISCGGGGGSASSSAANTPTTPSTPTPPTNTPTTAFKGDIVLASPTGDSIKLNLYSTTESGAITVAYGTVSGRLDTQTATANLSADKPLEVSLTNLAANTRYYYRVSLVPANGSTTQTSDELQFQTARPAGSTFMFALQGDSHPERLKSEFDPTLYQRTLDAVAADRPDFYIAMGDDFSVDTLDATTITEAQVRGRYTLQRPYFSTVARRASLFLVNGNHEQAARYLLDGTPNNVAVWAQNSRNSLYSQPAPDRFYGGNSEPVTFIGQLRNYYSWTWGIGRAHV